MSESQQVRNRQLHKEIERLTAETVATDALVGDLIEVLRDALDLARTGLAPDALNMTQEQWSAHRLNKIAAMLSLALKELP